MGLRIKDGVDLKELEKFGFELKTDKYTGEYYYLEGDVNDYIMICTDDRVLILITIDCEKINNAIFDLIQAGLVEKVEE